VTISTLRYCRHARLAPQVALLSLIPRRSVTSFARSLPTLAAAALVVSCASASGSSSPPSATSGRARTLVAVFAHPDDETIVAPALSHAARNGATVYLVVAPDGRRGVSKHAGIPAGDSLAKVRAGEARCSAAALGAQPPVMLGFEDAGLAVLSPWPGEPLDRMEKRIDSTLRALHPDVVLTWGPEGGYGHQDHRLVGDVVTQVFQKGAVGSARLLYVGFTADRIAGAPRWYGSRVYPTAPALLTTRIAFDEQDHEAARRAIACHKSQATEADMNESYTALTHLWTGVVAFQQWRGGPSMSKFF
jgi:LmbE family N-acetylglucosaminyl deacetylase